MTCYGTLKKEGVGGQLSAPGLIGGHDPAHSAVDNPPHASSHQPQRIISKHLSQNFRRPKSFCFIQKGHKVGLTHHLDMIKLYSKFFSASATATTSPARHITLGGTL